MELPIEQQKLIKTFVTILSKYLISFFIKDAHAPSVIVIYKYNFFGQVGVYRNVIDPQLFLISPLKRYNTSFQFINFTHFSVSLWGKIIAM